MIVINNANEKSVLICKYNLLMGSLEKVPCIEVDSSNFTEIWPHMIQAINAASWIALDLVSLFLKILSTL